MKQYIIKRSNTVDEMEEILNEMYDQGYDFVCLEPALSSLDSTRLIFRRRETND